MDLDPSKFKAMLSALKLLIPIDRWVDSLPLSTTAVHGLIREDQGRSGRSWHERPGQGMVRTEAD